MDNKKSGIRLRHLEQQNQGDQRRDLSPGLHRKKIFEKLPNRNTQDRPNKVESNGNMFGISNEKALLIQYEELIENFKKKTMQVQLRDQTIRYLNKQLDDLKKEMRLKDKQILQLTLQMERLKKQATEHEKKSSNISKNVYQTFKDNEQMSMNNKQMVEGNNYSPFNNYSREYNDNNNRKAIQNRDRTNSFKHLGLSEEISLTNLNVNNKSKMAEQYQIVSPFMVLNNDKKSQNTFSSQITVKNDLKQVYKMEKQLQTYPNNKIVDPFDQKNMPSKSFERKSGIHNVFQENNKSNKPVQSRIISNYNNNNNFSEKNDKNFSGFYNNSNNYEFDFKKQQLQNENKRNIVSTVDKQLQKFNIFGQQSEFGPQKNNKKTNKSQIYSKSHLQIQNSQEFKFEDLEPSMFGGFNESHH